MITRDAQMAPKDDLGLAFLALAQASGMTPQHGARVAVAAHKGYLAHLPQEEWAKAADQVWAEVAEVIARTTT